MSKKNQDLHEAIDACVSWIMDEAIPSMEDHAHLDDDLRAALSQQTESLMGGLAGMKIALAWHDIEEVGKKWEDVAAKLEDFGIDDDLLCTLEVLIEEDLDDAAADAEGI